MAVMACWFSAPALIFAMDKRTPLVILPYGSQAIQFISGYVHQRSDQYTLAGSTVSETESEAFAVKTLYRATPIRRVELAMEAQYILKRYQRQTSPSGKTSYTYDAQGPGDTSMAVTLQLADHQQSGWGLIAGIELKLPTGDEEQGLGSGSYDVIGRVTALTRTPVGLPYVMAIYTWAGQGSAHGVATDAGDDLYAAAGLRTRPWNNFSFDIRGGMYVRTTGIVQENQGVPVYVDRHNASLYLIEAHYGARGTMDVKLAYEALYPETHRSVTNNTAFIRDSDRRDQVVLAVLFFW